MKYNPISCNLFDRIESLAVTGKKVKINYHDKEDKNEIEGKIKNVFSRDKAEFLLINDVSVRLDMIISIEEID